MKGRTSIFVTLLLLVVIVVVTVKTAQGFRNEGFQLDKDPWINGLEWAGIVVGSLALIFLIYTAMSGSRNSNSNY